MKLSLHYLFTIYSHGHYLSLNYLLLYLIARFFSKEVVSNSVEWKVALHLSFTGCQLVFGKILQFP